MKYNIEIVIGKIIHRIHEVDWMRYNMFSEKNIYKNIPMLIFRLNENNPVERLEKLKKCISNFEGNNTWKIFKDPLSRHGNYILTISVVEDVRKDCLKKDSTYNEKEYFGETVFKLYCEQAIEDIPLIAKHIYEEFEEGK